jgi:hypothetical protein
VRSDWPIKSITVSVKLIPVSPSMLRSNQFKPIYPSLNYVFDDTESFGIQAKRDLELLLRFLTVVR